MAPSVLRARWRGSEAPGEWSSPAWGAGRKREPTPYVWAALCEWCGGGEVVLTIPPVPRCRLGACARCCSRVPRRTRAPALVGPATLVEPWPGLTRLRADSSRTCIVSRVVLPRDHVQARVGRSGGRESQPERGVLGRAVRSKRARHVGWLPVTVGGEAALALRRVDVPRERVEGGRAAGDGLHEPRDVREQEPHLVVQQQHRRWPTAGLELGRARPQGTEHASVGAQLGREQSEEAVAFELYTQLSEARALAPHLVRHLVRSRTGQLCRSLRAHCHAHTQAGAGTEPPPVSCRRDDFW
eukprot:scaffold14789_cov105-Isochrysis_galbana.AAC.3